jgi:hypothetical protein
MRRDLGLAGAGNAREADTLGLRRVVPGLL